MPASVGGAGGGGSSGGVGGGAIGGSGGHNKDALLALSWRRLFLSRAKLKASSRASALLSGFAMIAMVEIQISDETDYPPGLMIAFSVVTTLLVVVHLLALMISICILPNIDAVASSNTPYPHPQAISESPHDRLHWYIELAWACSTGLGIILFIAEIALLCWVKFYGVSTHAAIASSILLVPVLAIFLAFAFHFYRTLIAHKYECSAKGVEDLENMAVELQTHTESAQHGAAAMPLVRGDTSSSVGGGDMVGDGGGMMHSMNNHHVRNV